MSIKIQDGIALVCFLFTSCSPTPTVTPAVPLTESNTSAASIPTLPAPADIPDVTGQILPTSALPTGSPLWLQIVSPLDETVVYVPQMEVSGFAPAGTVISINDEILIVGDDGQFQAITSLEEGPNLIEIIASDEAGNDASVLLTVTYEP